MENQEIPINANVLKWARSKSGLSLEDVAALAKVRPLKATKLQPQLSATERLEAWEDGRLSITWNQLEALARVYRRPVITFFLSSPPIEEENLPDFRTIGDKEIRNKSPEFSALLRRIYQLHEDLVDLVRSDGGDELQFIGTVNLESKIEEVVLSIRKAIDFSFDEQRRIKSSGDLLRILRGKIQEVGIYILFEGDLGSHHSRVSPEEFRGIAICHKLAPIIVINPNDAHAARIFTLMHEVAHLWLGESAVSNFNSLHINGNQGNSTEIFCNRVAAEFLVPEVICVKLFENSSEENWQSRVEELAKHFKVSRAVIARRLFDCRCIGREDYWLYFKGLQRQWARIKDKQDADSGGPNRNVMDKFRLGDKLIRTVMVGTSEGLLTLQDASRLLQVKVARFDAISS